ncbi:class I adenylate-forming enzyme family protein [Aestuariibius sp. 2305UL40-4]|uniref:class I adenylate-forming enzyme family protein n=1 Tax=Aestuariibius violaceus TaxID=3234132 RepID=UPI00345ED626
MPAPFNLAAHVLARATDRPDKIALAILGPTKAERWSYARLEAAVRGTATGLLKAGLEPSDRVLLRLGNSADFPIAYLGAITAGVIPVPTSAALTAPEVTALAADLSPAAILHDGKAALPDHPASVHDLATLRSWRDLPPAEYATGDPDRAAYIVYTSGTSGQPRGVIHAHRAILARQMMVDGWYGLTKDDRLLHAGAFNWTYTLGTGLLDPWTIGATALIPQAGTKPDLLPLLMKRHEATLFAAAPGVYRQLLRASPLLDQPHLRHGLSAGEKLPDQTRAAWETATGTKIHEAFGMSECSTFLSGSPARAAPPGTSGYPQPGRRVTLRTGGTEANVGTIAIHRSDPGLMLGYLNAPEETAARFDGDWFLTGDLGRAEPDGAIIYLGRADDMMNAGGVRVSPLEVEAALAAHPEITDIAAAEVAVKSNATIIAAFYTAARDIVEDDLKAFAATRLARYKQPRLYRRLAELPRGANGKLLRRQLRADFETEKDPVP